MEIILLEKIDNLGGIGEKVKVKPGYARNYLIPQGKATLATAENLAKVEARRIELLDRAKGELGQAQARAARMEGQVLHLRAVAGPEGKLFGSIGTIDIAEACESLGVSVERSEVRLPDGPLRLIGEHQIELHFHTDVNVPLTVVVESDAAESAAVVAMTEEMSATERTDAREEAEADGDKDTDE